MNCKRDEPGLWALTERARRERPLPLALAVACTVLALGLRLGAVVVQAQTSPTAAPTAVPAANCAVTTVTIGGLNATEFFGLSGGPTGFRQSFGAPAGADRTSAQGCIRLELANPTPGDLVPIGGYVIEGFAFDPNAAAGQGSGLSSVQVFLDDPDHGGAAIGAATAAPNPGAAATSQFGLPNGRAGAFGDQFANAGFHITVQIPTSANGAGHALFVLTQSLDGNRTGEVAVPVAVGALSPLPRQPLVP